MRYMMLIKHFKDYDHAKVPAALYAAMGPFVEELIKQGVMIDGAGLQPMAKATQVRLSRGRIAVTDGPFTETKEIVGGYALCEFKTREEAVAMATQFHGAAPDSLARVRGHIRGAGAGEPGLRLSALDE